MTKVLLPQALAAKFAQHPGELRSAAWQGSWKQLLVHAQRLAMRLEATPLGQKTESTIAAADPGETLLAMLALMLAGKVPVLGAAPLRQMCPEPDATLEPSRLRAEAFSVPPAEQAVGRVGDESAWDEPALAFHTSGSTDTRVRVYKSWRVLIEEASEQARCFALSPGMRVLSLVPPVHIYGFLFAFALPLISGASVELLDVHAMPAGPEPELLQKADVLVSVPALWTRIKRILTAERPLLVFSSAAPLGQSRVQEFYALCGHPGTRLVELFGSTETGGIGYRVFSPQDRAEERFGAKPFRCLKGVRLQATEQGPALSSPYLYPKGPLTLDDELELLPGERFLHRGRTDRVIKYAGRRESLGEIEQHLSELVQGRAVKCFFVQDPERAKNGTLLAFVQGEPLDLGELRRRYSERFPTPFPSEVYFVPSMPHDGLGKTSLEALLGLVKGV